jgi:hypothetical protein
VRVAGGIAALVVLLTGCGGGASASPYRATTRQDAKKLMVRYLDAKYLTYHWVACLRTGTSFKGVAIVRCNVNFGDPHIEAYCIVLKNGRLYSDHQDAAIPCRRDNRAPPATIVTS